MTSSQPPQPGRGSWTRSQVEALGVITDVPTAASVLGIGRSTAYNLIHRDEFPVRVIHMGSRLRVPVAQLLELLDGTWAGTEDTAHE